MIKYVNKRNGFSIFGEDPVEVAEEAKKAVARIDPYRSPSAGPVLKAKNPSLVYCKVTVYGLD